MAKVGKRKVHTVSVTIQWYEEEPVAQGAHSSAALAIVVQSQPCIAGADSDDKTLHPQPAQLVGKRLLPTDRLVLNALRSRVPLGKQITTQVRIRELEVECEISRRQVQICVKRLSEKGIIKRLIKNTELGGTSGYRYHLSNDALHR